MTHANFCQQCGEPQEIDAHFCSKCGANAPGPTIEEETEEIPLVSNKKKKKKEAKPLPKSGKVALSLCLLFGVLGVHRFYVGKIWTGIAMLLTGGFLGVWVIFDIVSIIKNKFTDKYGNPLEVSHNLSPIKELLFIIGAIIIWFGLFIWSVVVTLSYLTSDLMSVVTSQLNAIKTNHMDVAYSYSAQEFQQIFSIKDFNKYIDQFPALKNNAEVSFGERRILNNTGFIRVILTAKDGTKTPVVYQLLKENGQWKILTIKIITPPTLNKPQTN